MQPPLNPETLLHQRYQIVRLLGQGGFGRTYLAHDQGRFQELCALKEFVPYDTSPQSLAKSQELFQREASTLYQIQHPQIPRFHATFEEQERLFIVQDYIEGQTLRELLKEKQSQGQMFHEWASPTKSEIRVHCHRKNLYSSRIISCSLCSLDADYRLLFMISNKQE